MNWLNYSLLATTLWAAYWQNSVAGVESSNTTEETTTVVNPKENEILLQSLVPEPTSTDLTENRTGVTSTDNFMQTDEVGLKSGQKRESEGITFNDIKPLLLFPILPYLFPPREEENLNSGKDEFFTPRNDSVKIDGNPTDVKPFIFFDFAFNIRQIPINNATEKFNDSKIINVTKLSINDEGDNKLDSSKNRRRRNTKMETPGFFDDAPFFPDSELDEFLPRPELFFPDLPFHHKPAKKLSRRKRDQKRTDLKNDLKSFFDAFDEAFMRTKRELEWTDPILKLLRGGEQAFDEDKKEADDLFSQLPDTQEKPSVKWRIQRNIKRLNNDRPADLTKAQDSPTIIVDKVVKIGEFHVHDDGHNKLKKKRGLFDSKDEMNSSSDKYTPKSISELTKQEGTKRKKKVHIKISYPEEDISKETDSTENKSSPQVKDSFSSASVNLLTEPHNDGHDVVSRSTNNTEKLYSLMKMFDALKGKMEVELKNAAYLPDETIKKTEAHNHGKESNSQLELKKNLTQLLKQFLVQNKNLEEPKIVAKTSLGEHDDSRHADWTEKETLQNTNILGKGSRERRQKKNYNDYEEDTHSDRDRHIADLNHLLLQVTVPTVIVFGIIFLICFFSLQTKGKVCTSLFKPRQVLIVNDEAATQLRSSSTKKVQAL